MKIIFQSIKNCKKGFLILFKNHILLMTSSSLFFMELVRFFIFSGLSLASIVYTIARTSLSVGYNAYLSGQLSSSEWPTIS